MDSPTSQESETEEEFASGNRNLKNLMEITINKDSEEIIKIGFYNHRERQQRIRKYKEKVKRYLKGDRWTRVRYRKRRELANQKPRYKGKFVKQ